MRSELRTYFTTSEIKFLVAKSAVSHLFIGCPLRIPGSPNGGFSTSENTSVKYKHKDK